MNPPDLQLYLPPKQRACPEILVRIGAAIPVTFCEDLSSRTIPSQSQCGRQQLATQEHHLPNLRTNGGDPLPPMLHVNQS